MTRRTADATGPLNKFWISVALCLCAVFAAFEHGEANASDVSGASLLAAAGYDQPFSNIEADVRLQLIESRSGLSEEVVVYAAQPFNGVALTAGIAADVEAALPEDTRRAVIAFFASPLGAKFSAMGKQHHDFLRSIDGEGNAKIMNEGGNLIKENERGPLYRELHFNSGKQSIDDRLLWATSHALIAAEGKLDDAEGPEAIDAVLKAEFPQDLLDLVREFDLPSFAYGYRDASMEDLEAFRGFLASKEGAAFVAATQDAVDKRLDDASAQLLKRLKEKKS